MENQRRAKWTARARFGLLQSKPCRSLPAQQARLLSHNTGASGREEAGEGRTIDADLIPSCNSPIPKICRNS